MAQEKKVKKGNSNENGFGEKFNQTARKDNPLRKGTLLKGVAPQLKGSVTVVNQ